MVNDTVVLDGECELLVAEDGEAGVVTVGGSYPIYSGETTVTPSMEEQVLQTSMKSVMTNIIINPIPNNYGLITWNGSTLTVS